jgi:hypothetical protein
MIATRTRSSAGWRRKPKRSRRTFPRRIVRSVDQLTAGQEQMTREITKLQAV